MAGKTMLQLAIDALRKFDGNVVHLNAIKTALRLYVASGEKKVENYLRMLEETSIIRETGEAWKFKVTIDPQNNVSEEKVELTSEEEEILKQ